MGLFGALFAGVSGLDSQSNKIGLISNNISNVNTVGYKQGSADFDTLVVPSGSTSFSPGGVIGGNSQLVNQQGTISATQSSTDVAISGGGLLVVSASATGVGSTGTGTPLYTRAGNFTQDDQGNFVNSDGYYLQGLPVNSDGVTAQANQQNLETVSVNQSATGAATATSTVTVAANLNAAQKTLLGAPVVASMQGINGTSTVNQGATANQILVGNDVPGTSMLNNVVRGDTIGFVSQGADSTDTAVYTYGGFAIGRNVTTTSNISEGKEATAGGGLGDVGNLLDTETGSTITNNGDGTVTFSISAAAAAAITAAAGAGTPSPYVVGGNASIGGVTTGIQGLTAAQLNGEWPITEVDPVGDTVTVNVGTTVAVPGGSLPGTGNVSNRTYPFTGNILNATSTVGDFMGSGSTAINPATTFTAEALKFSISINGNTPATFSYSSTPDPSAGTFNNLSTLAQAISDSSGLTATVTGGRLYVSAEDANLPIAITNGDANGTPSTNPPLAGINWTQELDLPTSLPGNTLAAPGTTLNYFNSLQGLANVVNATDPTNLVATITNPTGASSLTINEANPEQTLTVTDGAPVAPATQGSILKELGIANVIATVPAPAPPDGAYTTGLLPIVYSAASATQDMSSGSVTPQFSKDVTVYDAQGNSHTVAMNFVKLGTNSWAMELTAVPATDINSSIKNASGVGDGQIASGILTFNGDGELTSVFGTISHTDIPINWTNGASPSKISLNLGVGTTAGILQSAASFNVSSANQNGSPVGELTGVSIDQNGYVIAAFSNGQTQKLYQVPLASVNNPDGLEAVSGNAYIQTITSGIANLEIAGTSGVGTFTPSALEQSNVDLSTQLTDLIVAQQAYGANSKVLTVADSLLQELDQIIQ